MLSEEEIKQLEQAQSNILRGTDIESAALILEKAIIDNYIFTGGRVNILKLATRQILYFIENSKARNNVGDKHILDYVKENVALEPKANKYDSLVKKIKDKIEWLTDNILDNDYASINDKDTAEEQVGILQELLKEVEE